MCVCNITRDENRAGIVAIIRRNPRVKNDFGKTKFPIVNRIVVGERARRR